MILEVGESLPHQDLAFPSRWISQENWCLLMSCQGSCGHCYYRKLSLSSQGMGDIRGRGRWCLQSRLLKPACPGGLVRSVLVAPHQNSWGPKASSALLPPFSASWTGQTISELLLLLGTASERCCSWCMQTLHSFGTGLLFLSKGSRKKKFKTKNSSGCV